MAFKESKMVTRIKIMKAELNKLFSKNRKVKTIEFAKLDFWRMEDNDKLGE